MAHFATLLHGELADVLRELENGDCSTSEIGAALCNTIRRVEALQRQQHEEIGTLRVALQGVLDPYHEGQVTIRPEATGYVQAAIDAGERALTPNAKLSGPP